MRSGWTGPSGSAQPLCSLSEIPRKKKRVAYQGLPGAYAELAARKSFPDDCRFLPSESLLALLEGLLRVLIFIAYLKLVSRSRDVRRTFEYHGAEHKCINCIEHGLPLTVDNVALSSKEHKRCGTSFLVYVMLISILLFMLLRFDSILLKFLSRILLIPLIAGISYELLRLVGLWDNALTRLLFVPGMWMQGLTTKEPDRSEIEVAIAAVEAVFDWRKWEREKFPEESGGAL